MTMRSVLVLIAILMCGSAGAADEFDTKADTILQEGLTSKNPIPASRLSRRSVWQRHASLTFRA
jgi:hypothetical protein